MNVVQPWVTQLSMMQQTVLLTAIRGPDGMPKYGAAKWLLRWFRRCILFSAMDRRIIESPLEQGGGSFTGPASTIPHAGGDAGIWEPVMLLKLNDYLRELDATPHHFQLHFLHAVEILGYKHPTLRTRAYWHKVYLTLVKDMHLEPESEEALDRRLGDNRAAWLAANNPATVD